MPEAQVSKNQHTVPQGYLKKFTYDGKRLYVFDKITQRYNSRSTKSVASLPYFYDFSEDIRANFRDPQLVEHIFSDIEPIFYDLRDNMLKSIEEQGKITNPQRVAMSYFMSLQLLRTLEYRRNLIDMINKLQTQVTQLIMPDALKVNFKIPPILDESEITLGHAHMMFPPGMLNEFVNALSNHIWMIGVNETTEPIYTSDTPVVTKAHSAQRGGIGVASPGIEIAFPLTEKYILILKERTVFREQAKLDGKARLLNTDEVRYYNRLQVFRSYRQVYCSSPEFNVAEQTCQRFPNVCDPSQARSYVRSVPHPSDKTLIHLLWPDPDRAEFEVH